MIVLKHKAGQKINYIIFNILCDIRRRVAPCWRTWFTNRNEIALPLCRAGRAHQDVTGVRKNEGTAFAKTASRGEQRRREIPHLQQVRILGVTVGGGTEHGLAAAKQQKNKRPSVRMAFCH